MSIWKKLINFSKSKEAHFLYLDLKTFKRYRFLIWLVINFNKNYKWCEIYRKKYKNHTEIVVFALRWYGKNVKRRTNGFAKERVLTGEAIKCIYCDGRLTKENATAEHILPVASGGNNCQVNLIVCCLACNNERGDANFYEYLYSKKPQLKGMKLFI